MVEFSILGRVFPTPDMYHVTWPWPVEPPADEWIGIVPTGPKDVETPMDSHSEHDLAT